MKKIILATTALVSVAFAGNALAQESQMMSSMGNNINIGGFYEFGYSDYSDDAHAPDGDGSAFSGDSELFIDFASVSDSGLEYGVSLELEIVNGRSDDTGGDNNIDEASIYIAGDFGQLIHGHNDHAGDSFQTWIGTDRTYGQDDAMGLAFANLSANGTEGDDNAVSVKPHTVNAPYGDDAKITYLSPSFSGFQFGVSLEDDGTNDDDATSIGGKYDFSAYGVDVTLRATSYSYGNDDRSVSYGATLGYGDLTLTAAYADFEDTIDHDKDEDDEDISPDSVTSKVNVEPEVYGFGIGYDISDDLFVSAYYATSEDDVLNQEVETMSFGVQYTIAQGLTATAAYNIFDLEQTARTASTGVLARTAATNEGEEFVVQVEFAF